MAATWLAWTVFAGASGAGAYRANNGDNPLGNSCGDGDAAAITINANKNTWKQSENEMKNINVAINLW